MVPRSAWIRPSSGRFCISQLPAWSRTLSTAPPVQSSTIPLEYIEVSRFRDEHFLPELPLHIKACNGPPAMSSVRASSKWFARRDTHEFSSYMTQFTHHLFPYEFTTVPSSEKTNDELDPFANFLCWLSRSPNPMDAVLAEILQSAMPLGEYSESRFFMFEAPLSLIMRASEFNKGVKENLTRLYIAQSQIPDLPPQLQDDLETPRLVRETGKGDVYSSSIWIGLEPTFTPLHRDPNPNLFFQLLGGKTVRLMPPTVGERMYREVQDRLRRSGSSRIRGFEMMDGPERVMLSAAAWGREVPAGCVEAQLDTGDALFIPKGWWHSVKSTRCDGRLNASVNWWFR